MATSIFQLPGFCNSAVLKLLLLSLLLLQTCLNVSLLIESLLLDSWETFFGAIANCLSNIRSKTQHMVNRDFVPRLASY